MRLDLRTRPSPPHVLQGADCSPVPMHSWQSVTCSGATASQVDHLVSVRQLMDTCALTVP